MCKLRFFSPPPAVYERWESLQEECKGLEDPTGVLVSEIVLFLAEARAFVYQGQVLDCALYEGEADLSEAIAFTRELVRSLPS